jgi:iron-sulfur cluster assembly accessory protein
MVTLTSGAEQAVQGFRGQDEQLKDKPLRIFVQGGGCSGFEYGFTFSDKQEGDETIQFDGFEVVIDAMSLPYLQGCRVDFVDGLQGKGFTVENPNASGNCGCGKSFSV